MEQAYKILISDGVGEIVEKKSRFIATVRRCETEEEAVSSQINPRDKVLKI